VSGFTLAQLLIFAAPIKQRMGRSAQGDSNRWSPPLRRTTLFESSSRLSQMAEMAVPQQIFKDILSLPSDELFPQCEPHHTSRPIP
jgi:hypothetical protein